MSEDARRSAFGPNDWLLDEMYRAYLADPSSVGESWQEFFADYRPPAGRTVPALAPVPAAPTEEAATAVPRGAEPLRGGAARLAANMDASLAIPTATTVRTVPVKLLEENRALLNHHLKDSQAGKVSFTHILAWALVRALKARPGMWAVYREIDGQPHRITPEHVNLGLAVDVVRRDGSRTLLVPNLKAVEQMDFATFFAAYNDLLRRVNTNQISPEDFAGTTVSLTNPGMLGTSQSVPRLMPEQSFILAAGSIAYPPEYQLADPEVVARVGVSKVMTLTCTYDHRVIQGAESGTFLALLAALLAGEEDFYEEMFAALDAPHLPFRLARDVNPALAAGADALVAKQAPVLHLINMYRVRGHLLAHLNPLGSEMPRHSELELARYGLSIWDLDREFFTGGLAGRQRATLREILRILQDAYCDTVGIEYMHIQEPDQKVWIQERVEGVDKEAWLTAQEKRRLLFKLNAAEAFERFLHTNYLGHKRFSLEGGESVIPMLDRLLSRAADAGVEEVVMGMAHRGRLNVLSNIVGMSYKTIFRAFEGELDPESREGTGDVKYHLGAKGTFTSPAGGRVRVTLASNPSHLEAVNPVVEGMARAIQDGLGDGERRRVLPVLLHGDAAFAGQGVVAETLNMSALAGYRTGGTVHIVINNGIGFTTAPADARSSVYATDVAKMVQAPIFHVNGDDPEACLRVMDLAFEFRHTFGKDVVVDLICYRVHGHNEADEPAYTQPLMYERIAAKRSVRKLYTERLINRGDLTLEEAERALADYKARLEEAFAETRDLGGATAAPPATEAPGGERKVPAVDRSTLEKVLAGMTSVPPGFTMHPKLARAFAGRARMLAEDAVDWGTGELLAFGSLLLEGVPVRLSGQDSRRGTFSQRHAVLVDFKTGASHTPLRHLSPSQAPFLIYDSLLSEYAVCGFEYGYSVSRPEALVLWEAQFGDFANGAQIVIDQFLAAAEEKWGQRSRLVLLLPHGQEGQGPEHSSARLERFLQLCAGDNLRVAVPTTAAQHFHLLRRQAYLEPAVPLVVMTPKSLLRAREARSAAAEFTTAGFRAVLDDPAPPAPARRLLLCTGKVAYDLLARRGELGADTAVVRLEQLNPFPANELATVLGRHGIPDDVRWVQEEPRNMGAWSFVAPLLAEVLGDCRVRYVGRPASGSPATGSARRHQQEQQALVEAAFARG
ncbi:MAG: multifunctional oxoglutarate decarboxylase/oxoglutarate dehydrogenase thiamine pyrophosphate-binding subunit/dihydrolipoyllysine-residue succinyltransferase subunit [Acidobacteriota bacterium]|jgi:2-oxoglutarate dehydrogenase E1 component